MVIGTTTFLWLTEPVDETGQEAVDFWCGGCRGEQESEDESDNQLPCAEACKAVGDVDENPEDGDDRDGHGHAASLLSVEVAAWCFEAAPRLAAVQAATREAFSAALA